MSKVKDILAQYKPECIPDSALVHLAILQYELGDLSKCIIRSWWNPTEKKNYRGDAKLAVADAITQLKYLAEFFQLDFDECDKLGMEHLEERLKEARERFDKTGEWR